tara:strand:- start:137 stop:634 length:498 start_codon:yes stop_codon:yes gene_type:complete
MWAVIKCDPKKLELMKSDISNKLNGTTKYYSPKILIQYYLKNRLISKKINLLGDYIFCFNSSLSDINSINLIRFSRGLKYFLNGYTFFQHDINKFIQLCRSYENKNGFVSLDFINLNKSTKYKFISGPFASKIFEVINFQKNKIDILIGKFKTSLKRKDFLFRPV